MCLPALFILPPPPLPHTVSQWVGTPFSGAALDQASIATNCWHTLLPDLANISRNLFFHGLVYLNGSALSFFALVFATVPNEESLPLSKCTSISTQ